MRNNDLEYLRIKNNESLGGAAAGQRDDKNNNTNKVA